MTTAAPQPNRFHCNQHDDHPGKPASRMYLDCAAGIAVGALGHAHPELRKVLAERAGKLRHVSKPPVGCEMREPWSDRARDILDACVKHGLPALAAGPNALRPEAAVGEAAAETLG